MRLTSCLRLAVLAALLVFTITPPAAAYIDPTAAGAALQSMYVMGMSIVMALAVAPKRIAGWFGRLLKRTPPEAPEGE